MSSSRLATRLFCALLSLPVAAPVLADPPSHAPAHGWRKKHDPYYRGYTGKQWERDYGIIDGRCNREAVGAVLGGVVGGVVGSNVGKGDGRAVAIVVGTVIGAAIGAKIGRDLDDADRACIGHALELGRAGQPVRWEAEGVHYAVVPQDASGGCRRYTLTSERDGKKVKSDGRACRRDDGSWAIR